MARRLKVALVSGSHPEMSCGVGDYTARLAEALVDAGVQATVVTSIDARLRPSEGYGTVQLTRRWGLRELPRMVRRLLAMDWDVLHLQYPTQGYQHGFGVGLLVPAIRVLAPRRRIVVTLHEYRHLHVLHRAFVAATLRWGNALVTPDNSQLVSMPFQPRTMEIPLASNLAADMVADPPTKDDDELVVGTFGMLREDKGVDLLIDAFDAVASERPARLVIAGDPGPDEAYVRVIQQRIDKSRVASRISRTGRLSPERLTRTLRTFDACVLPYRQGVESNRLTYAAAVATGVYTITTSSSDAGYDASTNTSWVQLGDQTALVRAILEAPLHPRRPPQDTSGDWRRIASLHRELYVGVLGAVGV